MSNKKTFTSLLSDYGFKVTFADEADTLFLRKALQALLQQQQAIKKVEFIRSEYSGITKAARGALLDIICVDEYHRTFIVEMQLSHYKEFMQRAKFYVFHRFNTLVRKGNFRFENLPPIYCVSFLARNVFPASKAYYHIGRLKNQFGEELDQEITHIVVEISKFNQNLSTIDSDLDKLIYFMKHQERVKGVDKLPKKLDEEWIRNAINKLDQTQMSPEQRWLAEMQLAKTASIIHQENAERAKFEARVRQEVEQAAQEKVKAAQEQLEAAQEKADAAQAQADAATEAAQQAALDAKIQLIKNLLNSSPLSLTQIAQAAEVPVAFVETVQDQLL